MVVAHDAAKTTVLFLVLVRAGQVGLEGALGPVGWVSGDVPGGASKVLEVGAVVSDRNTGDSGKHETLHLKILL